MPAEPQQPPASAASRTATLSGVALLAGLSEDLRRRLAGEAREVRVRAGDWLFREGDAATSAFLLRSGRLEVVAEGPPPVLIRTLKRGAVLGELALLQEGTRSASVRARRDSAMIELDRAHFEVLIRDAPEFALSLTRTMGAQLAANRGAAAEAEPPHAIAVIALDAGAPSDAVAAALARELGRHGTVAHLIRDPGRDRADFTGVLDRAERDHERVLLAGGDGARGEAWTDFCRREADLIVAVTSGDPDATWRENPAPLCGCELLVVGPAIAARDLERIVPRETQVLATPAALAPALARTARRIAGRSVGVVLSGGGARAFAHIGVLDELRRAGVVLDRIAGVSMGAIVAALAAMELDGDAIDALFRHGFVDHNPSNDYTLPAYSLIRGRKTYRLLEEAMGAQRIEELARRFFCVSCDLFGRELVVHRSGPLHEAVYASVAIPGVFPPVPDARGRLLVDGGVLDNLPVGTMARTAEGPVIAVDVGQRPSGAPRPARPRLDAFARPVRRALTGSPEELPRLGETLMRTLTLGGTNSVLAAARHADLVIAPRVEGVGMLDWKQLPRVREIGRAAAAEALRDAADVVGRWGD